MTADAPARLRRERVGTPAREPDAPTPPTDRPGRTTAGMVGLAVLCAALFLATLALGSVRLPLGEVAAVLTGNGSGDGAQLIVEQVRLPRALTALIAGAALGLGGLQMQTLFRNPLADPFILGISAGASLGVALVVLAGGSGGAMLALGFGLAGGAAITAAAATGALAVMLLVLAASRRVESPATVLIIGLMVGYAVTAVVSVLVQGGFGDLERVRAFVAWGFGSFAGTSWSDLVVLSATVAVGLAIGVATMKALNALLLGDAYAASMGVRVRGLRVVVVIGASLLAGGVTAFCGPIAFIGVASPHLARGLLRSSDHRVLLPATLLVGAAVALAAGLVAQLPGQDATLPLNSVTALVGAPVVVAVLLRLRRSSRAVVT